MKLRCASCGWTDQQSVGVGHVVAQHLAGCRNRDDALYVPRWHMTIDSLEVAWTTTSPEWGSPFAPSGQRVIDA